MHKAILVGILATSLAAPVAAYAQPAPAAAAPQTTTEEVFTIRPTQWFAIGVGVVVGAAVLDVVLPSNIAFVVGGVIGGYLANAWYNGREVQLQLSSASKT